MAVDRTTSDQDGVRASTVALVRIEEVDRLLEAEGPSPFTPAELAYARARVDPSRRLAARLAAKWAAVGLLGAGVDAAEIEVVRAETGPPSLRLSPRARKRLADLGARRTLVSLTHERHHAAALVLLLEDA